MPTPVSLAVGDINKDGKLDLVAAIPCADFMCSTGTINVLLGKGDGTFQTPLSQVVASGVKSPVLADLNGDGTLDLMVLDGINFAALLPGNGDGTFQSPQYYSAGADLGSVAVADFNGDGKPDAVTAGGVLLNIGTPDFSLYAPSVTPNPLPSGQSAKGTVTIGSDNGFTGSISLTCSVQPATAQTPTCSLSPTLAQVSTGQSIDSTLTISTSSSRGSLTAPAAPPGAWQRYLIGLPVGGLALIGMGILPRRSKKNRIRAIALASMIFSGLTFQMACGGDTSQSVTITAPCSYTITINGSSGSTQHATTLSITVPIVEKKSKNKSENADTQEDGKRWTQTIDSWLKKSCRAKNLIPGSAARRNSERRRQSFEEPPPCTKSGIPGCVAIMRFRTQAEPERTTHPASRNIRLPPATRVPHRLVA